MSDRLESLRKPASWVVVCKATGRPVRETFSPAVCAAINREKYDVVSILDWLGRVNRVARGKA